MDRAAFTTREVAELAGVPKRLVEKAIEEHVLRVRFARGRGTNARARRKLPSHAVAYAAIVTKLSLRLSAAHKKHLLRELGRVKPARMRKARVALAPAVEIDVGRLIGDKMARAERYRVARDACIEINDDVMVGTPVIRGTRMTVYSVLGRIEHGETVADILADNPDLSRVAIEAALIYARTHPLIGRPGGRPWARAA
jgi:uncharacterized protein (DUF433 family)